MGTPEDSAQDKSSGEKAAPEAAKALGDNDAAPESGATANDLPKVESPSLAGSEAVDEPAAGSMHGRTAVDARGALPALLREPADEAPGAPGAASTSQPRSFRFALLGATVAAAAGIGALVGALTASGIGHQHSAEAAIPRSADARDVVSALKAQLAELSALKASLDAAKGNASAQFAKIGERLDSLERAQAEPAAKLAHIADAVDRLDKRSTAAPETTGSIAASQPPAARAPAASPAAPILHDWVVQNVRNGRAMIESRSGGLFLVGSGSVLPGLGRVQDVKRQDGEWVVVTEKGLIISRP